MAQLGETTPNDSEKPDGFALKAAAVTDANWWSLLPIKRPTIPEIDAGAAWIRTPIDAFVLRKLREKGLAPSAEADRRTLVRRLSFRPTTSGTRASRC